MMELETSTRATKIFLFCQLIHLNDKLLTDIKNYLQNKGQCNDKSISHKIDTFSCLRDISCFHLLQAFT